MVREQIHHEVSQALDARRASLAEAVTARQYELAPELAERYGERGRRHCLKDAEYHLSYLADAIASGSPSLFSDYVDWAQVMLAARGIPAGDLARNLEVLDEVLRPGGVAQQPREIAHEQPALLEIGVHQCGFRRSGHEASLSPISRRHRTLAAQRQARAGHRSSGILAVRNLAIQKIHARTYGSTPAAVSYP